jgi:hypothetical protein
MESKTKLTSRKKFLLWGTAAFSSISAFHFFSHSKKQDHKKSETVKMLTADGKLVEVDATKIYGSRREKISDEQLKNWVAKKKN